MERAINNLALRKPTKMSSLYEDNVASRAVDGKRNGNLPARSCTHTHGELGAWWQVDLQDLYLIKHVIISNRDDVNCELECVTEDLKSIISSELISILRLYDRKSEYV
jgi:hypothetical protein